MAEFDIDTKRLIGSVEERPVLWDETSPIYKDANATVAAWQEVCAQLKEDFRTLEEKEKQIFTEEAMKRWFIIRDSFARFCRKERETKKNGSGASKFRKFIFLDEMRFLRKLHDSNRVEDNVAAKRRDSETSQLDIERWSDASGEDSFTVSETSRVPDSRKRHKMDEFELGVLRDLEREKPNRHISFCEAILPALEEFNEHEALKFQMGVLELIGNIKYPRSRGIHNDQFSLVSSQLGSSANSTTPHTLPHRIHLPLPRTTDHCYHHLGQQSAQRVVFNPPSVSTSGAQLRYPLPRLTF